MSKKSKDKTKSKGSSLFPEFDEVNEYILDTLDDDPDVGLICNKCGQEYVYAAQFIESGCNEPNCDGILLILTGDDEMLTLSEAIKNGSASIKQVNSTNHQNSNAAGYTTYKSCSHPGDKVLFDYEGKQLFGSNNSSIREWSGKWQLIIDLAGVVTIPNVTSFISAASSAKFKELSKYVGKEKELPSEVLRLYWTDMGVPPVGLEFWQQLWAKLPEKTVIACMGGHGRTGTCLAAFMIANGVDFYSAVETVRKEHCEKAIETLGQEKYLHDLYVQYMTEEIVRLQEEPGDNSDRINGLKEDIEFALKNKPEPSVNTKSQSWQYSWDEEDDSVVAAPKSGKEATIYYSAGVKHNVPDGTPLARAVASGRNVKTVGAVIYVEECISTNCLVVDCVQPSHQAWRTWDISMTKVECGLASQF